MLIGILRIVQNVHCFYSHTMHAVFCAHDQFQHQQHAVQYYSIPEMCPRGQVRGLGLGSEVLGLGLLPLEAWPWKSSITNFSFGLSYCLHFSVNELMKV